MPPPPSNPPTLLDALSTDPGDETTRRFAYQWSCTGILACGLLDPNSEFEELYCEHHEDVLVRKRNGKFIGVQVKTRELGLELWKAGDQQVVDALVKFAQLEHGFPDQFESYRLATNHQFWKAKNNSRNLVHLLELARSSGGACLRDLPAALKTCVTKVMNASGCDCQTVCAALAKTMCDHSLPKLDDIVRALCAELQTVSGDNATPTGVRAAAKGIQAEVMRAASLQHSQESHIYLRGASSAAEPERKQRIEGKRITRSRIEQIIAEHANELCLLKPRESGEVPIGPVGSSRLEKKLDAGGLSVLTLQAAQDCQASAFHQYFTWRAKHGDDEARRRYEHLRVLALSEASSAYEDTRAEPPRPFGRAMYSALRERLRARLSQKPPELFALSEEHLLGFVYLLTEECKVWWSLPFKVDDEP